MAQNVQLSGAQVTKRSPWGVWGLSLITFGIYGIVWWHKINREMRDFSAGFGQPFNNDPNKAVLALFPGGILIVPAILTWLHTARRVNASQNFFSAGAPVAGVSGGLTVLLALLGGFHTIYLQSALNTVWDQAAARSSAGAPAPAPQPEFV